MFWRAERHPRLQTTAPPSGRRLGDVGLLLPSILLVVGVFGLPLVIMFWQAFSDPELGFGNFAWYLGDSVQRSVLLRTFTTGLEVTAICLILGYPYAYAMVAFDRRCVSR